jgi:hypothetical protein
MSSWAGRRMLEFLAKPRQRQRTQGQSEVSQCDIVEAGDQQQVRDDAPEPQGNDVGANPGTDGDQHTCGNLDHADRQHERMAADGNVLRDHGREVLVPIDQQVDEFVEAGQDRQGNETSVKDEERLVNGPSLLDLREPRFTRLLALFGQKHR